MAERRQQPTAAEIARFEAACEFLDDPNDPKQFDKWAKEAQKISDRGWNPAQVISALWNARPEFRTEGLTPKQAEEALLKEQAERQQAEASVAARLLMASMPEIEFHGAIIQQAAVTGRQIVVRGIIEPHPGNLPSHVPPANP